MVKTISDHVSNTLRDRVTAAKKLLHKVEDTVGRIEAEQTARCMAAICLECREPSPVKINPSDGEYWHFNHPHFTQRCLASAIRKLALKQGLPLVEPMDLPGFIWPRDPRNRKRWIEGWKDYR